MPQNFCRSGRYFWYFLKPGSFNLAMQHLMLENFDSGFICYDGAERVRDDR